MKTYAFDVECKDKNGKIKKEEICITEKNEEIARRKVIEGLNGQNLIVRKIALHSMEDGNDDFNSSCGPDDGTAV